jgi:hypothetical protein
LAQHIEQLLRKRDTAHATVPFAPMGQDVRFGDARVRARNWHRRQWESRVDISMNR